MLALAAKSHSVADFEALLLPCWPEILKFVKANLKCSASQWLLLSPAGFCKAVQSLSEKMHPAQSSTLTEAVTCKVQHQFVTL